ncbi:MAG: hypothetical protein AAFN74_15940, partial [Myxococcota bacterium]
QEALRGHLTNWGYQIGDSVTAMASGAAGHSKNVLERFGTSFEDPLNMVSLGGAIYTDFTNGDTTGQATQHALRVMAESAVGEEIGGVIGFAFGGPIGAGIGEFIGSFATEDTLAEAGSVISWLTSPAQGHGNGAPTGPGAGVGIIENPEYWRERQAESLAWLAQITPQPS